MRLVDWSSYRLEKKKGKVKKITDSRHRFGAKERGTTYICCGKRQHEGEE